LQYVPPQYNQPLPPAAKSGSGLKVLFIVLAVLGLLGILFIGGIWFAWRTTKQVAASKGIDLDSFTETRRGPARKFDACALLSKDDLTEILHLNVERVEGTGRSTHSTCKYYSSEAAQRASDEATEAIKKLQEASKSGNANTDQAEQIKNVGNMIRGITGVAGASSDAPMLSIEVDSDNAKAAMAGFKLGMGITTAAMDKDAPQEAKNLLHQEVKGIGDDAMFGPLLSLFMFRKGDVAVQIDGRTLPGGRDAQIAVAKRIAAKL
jgi:hypothetical protein